MGNITFSNPAHLRGAMNHALARHAEGQDHAFMRGLLQLLDLCAALIEFDPERRHARISKSFSCMGSPERTAVSFDFLIYEGDADGTFRKAVLNGGLIHHPSDGSWTIHT